MPKSALVVIDAQIIYERKGSPLFVRGFSKSLANINKLVGAFASASLPVIYVRHIHRKDNSDLGRMFDFTGEAEEANFTEGSTDIDYVSGLNIVQGATHLIKRRYSAFSGTDFQTILNTKDVDTLAICGYMSNFCCESTARDAHDRDYYVDFIYDATGCPDLDDFKQEQIIESLTKTLAGGYARINTTKEYLANMSK